MKTPLICHKELLICFSVTIDSESSKGDCNDGSSLRFLSVLL